MLKIINLEAKRSGTSILHGVNMVVKKGEIHAVMGPNGSGKSTLANAIMGNPDITVTRGSIYLNGKNITSEEVFNRAKMGLFMAFQYPVEISGVPVIKFLKLAYESRFNKKISLGDFLLLLNKSTKLLNISNKLIGRYLNEGFSGGEKKKLEILQMAILKPKFCILDETDSGLDVSALKEVATGIRNLAIQNKMGIIVITHYSRILKYLVPNCVHILNKGQIIKSGDMKIVEDLENRGYETLIN